MTDEERIEVDRVAHELSVRVGREAHFYANKYVEEARTNGETEKANFWEWVRAYLRPR
ncbi:hypothetical protein ACO0K2_08520 [Undibacterium sp. MH2W]|uniref:hypothetical protein n=1 Tax=Undibacterium sp. MH2W TaxID=3413044 RepID=UPI003BF218E9